MKQMEEADQPVIPGRPHEGRKGVRPSGAAAVSLVDFSIGPNRVERSLAPSVRHLLAFLLFP